MCSTVQLTDHCSSKLGNVDGRSRIEKALKDLFQDLREVTLEKDSELLKNCTSSPEPDRNDSLSRMEFLRVENLRTAGNDLYAMGDLKGAKDMYTNCITLLDKIPNEQYEWTSRLTLLTYSNRAEAHFRLKLFEEGLKDANKALEIDPKHVKSLARKGKILEALELYDQSLECFSAALEKVPRDLSIQRAISRCKDNFQQAYDGVFDLTKFYLDGRNAEPPPCCNFVGPVEIRKSKVATGRGLFAKRGVKMGDLLMVSNAIAQASDKERLVMQIATLCSSSPRRLEQVYSLSSEIHILGEEDAKVPSVDLFKPGGKPADVQGQQKVDLVRIHGIVKVNAITVLESSSGDESEVKYSALWLLPSFLNHSCVPNCVTYNPGRDILFVRAARDISAGEELCIAYFDVLKDLGARQASTSNWPFVCRCARCEWEGSLPKALNDARQRLLRTVQRAKVECQKVLQEEEQEDKMITVPVELACLILSLDRAIDSVELDLRHKMWVRGSVMDLYLASSRVLVGVLDTVEPSVRIQIFKTLLDAISALGGGDGMCLDIGVLLLEQVVVMYGKQSHESRVAESKLMEVFKMFHGKLSKNVFQALVSRHSQSTKRSMDSHELWHFVKALLQALTDVEMALMHGVTEFIRFMGDPLFEMD